MKTSLVVVIVSILTVSVSASARETLEIKGLQIGARIDCRTLNDVDNREGDFFGRSSADGCWSKVDNIRSAIVQMSFLGYQYQKMTYGVRLDGVLAFLIMRSTPKYDFQKKPWDFDDAVSAFTKKYGKPVEVIKSIGKNSFGSSFLQKKAVWKQGTQELFVGQSLYRVMRLRLRYLMTLYLGHRKFLRIYNFKES